MRMTYKKTKITTAKTISKTNTKTNKKKKTKIIRFFLFFFIFITLAFFEKLLVPVLLSAHIERMIVVVDFWKTLYFPPYHVKANSQHPS